MHVEIQIPNRDTHLLHRDECWQVHLRNQILRTIAEAYDRFNHEHLGPDHLEAIRRADAKALALDGAGGIWGRIDFSKGRQVPLDEVKDETICILLDAFEGRIIKTRTEL